MTDYQELMKILSTPRPNGSAAERETISAIQSWLKQHHIPYQLQPFRIYPYFFECIGIWLILSRSLLAVAVWSHWGWLTLAIAVLGVLGSTLDVALNWPLVTWPGARQGNNVIIVFSPPQAHQEIILCAHYDSKTEVLDHDQRMFFLERLKFGILLTVVLGIWGLLDRWLVGTLWGVGTFWIGVGLTVPMLLLAWGFGLHLALGRLLEPSQGAVDNGAACAILLGLARHLAEGRIQLENTKVTLALFTGEEVNMQGSRAYVRGRDWATPTVALNLEVMAQDGDYIYWEADGNVFRLVPTDHSLNETIAAAIAQVTGCKPLPAGPVNSDGGSFLFAGIPSTTIGTFDSHMGVTGFHRPTDTLDRVVMERLSEGVEILKIFLDLHAISSNMDMRKRICKGDH